MEALIMNIRKTFSDFLRDQGKDSQNPRSFLTYYNCSNEILCEEGRIFYTKTTNDR